MCGCKKNAKAITRLDPLKSADQLVSEGVAVWVQYNGPHAATTRRVPGGSTRYPVSQARCVLMAVGDVEAFKANNPSEFTNCTSPANNKVISLATTKPGVVFTPEQKQVIAEIEKAPAKTESSIVDITGLTVNDALPIIREAAEHTLNVWSLQEADRVGGPRQMILAAIAKRFAELAAESNAARK